MVGLSNPRKTTPMNCLAQARWTMTQTSNANYGSANFLSQVSTGNIGQIGVDEFVYDKSSGVLASLHEPPSMINLLNGQDSGCSFVMMAPVSVMTVPR